MALCGLLVVGSLYAGHETESAFSIRPESARPQLIPPLDMHLAHPFHRSESGALLGPGLAISITRTLASGSFGASTGRAQPAHCFRGNLRTSCSSTSGSTLRQPRLSQRNAPAETPLKGRPSFNLKAGCGACFQTPAGRLPPRGSLKQHKRAWNIPLYGSVTNPGPSATSAVYVVPKDPKGRRVAGMKVYSRLLESREARMGHRMTPWG